MPSELGKMIQIGIVVRDLDKAVHYYEDVFGVGPWRVEVMQKDTFKEMTLNGEPSTMELKCAFCSCYGMEIELIEPLNDSPQMRWLQEHGPGLQHLAFVPRDGFDSMMEKCMKINGKAPFMHGKDPSVGMEFAYLDLNEEMGMMLEIHNEECRKTQQGHEC